MLISGHSSDRKKPKKLTRFLNVYKKLQALTVLFYMPKKGNSFISKLSDMKIQFEGINRYRLTAALNWPQFLKCSPLRQFLFCGNNRGSILMLTFGCIFLNGLMREIPSDNCLHTVQACPATSHWLISTGLINVCRLPMKP